MQQLVVIVETIWGSSAAVALIAVFLAALSPKLRMAILGPPTDRRYDDK